MYLPGDSERDEYILNESGIIWAGAHNDMFTWPWNFAQVSQQEGNMIPPIKALVGITHNNSMWHKYNIIVHTCVYIKPCFYGL